MQSITNTVHDYKLINYFFNFYDNIIKIGKIF